MKIDGMKITYVFKYSEGKPGNSTIVELTEDNLFSANQTQIYAWMLLQKIASRVEVNAMYAL